LSEFLDVQALCILLLVSAGIIYRVLTHTNIAWQYG
jgi:hypothetical protein